MKTLIIHPHDVTTSFLSDIYADMDCTVIDEPISKSKLKAALLEHDRIIMMGHGDEYGLYGYGHYIITSDLVYILREKECVAIWCNADIFFKRYELNGIYTGMIISEMDEAMMFCFYQVKNTEIVSSNTLFANAMKLSINEGNFLDKVKEHYVGDDNAIIQFNKEKIYITENSKYI
jgi:hypothetical protein